LEFFFIFVSVCLLCGIIAIKDSRSMQYSNLTSEDLTNVDVGFSPDEPNVGENKTDGDGNVYNF